MKQLIVGIILLNSLLSYSASMPSTSSSISASIAAESGTMENHEASVMPSEKLILTQNKGKKQVTITEGMSLEILTKDKQKITGNFVQYAEGLIELDQHNETRTVNLDDVRKIVIHHKNSNSVAASLLKFTLGTSSLATLTLGSGALIGGIIALEKSVLLGVSLITVSIPLIYLGVQYYILAKKSRTKINLAKGWTVLEDR